MGSLPSLNEVEDMLHMQRRNQDALIRIRSAVVNQEQAIAEQMAQRKAFKTEDEHMAMYHEEYKGTGGFAGADPKKRRGVSPAPVFGPKPFTLSFPDRHLQRVNHPHTGIRAWLTTHYRKLPLLVVATVATEPKRRNGDGVQMEPERCATRVVYTTLS